MFGKYMNVMPQSVPPGFDAWLANNGGNYIAPAFQTYGMEWAGLPGSQTNKACWGMGEGIPVPEGQGCWHGTSENYTTATVGNVSAAWIERVVTQSPGTPFFAYVAYVAFAVPVRANAGAPAPDERGHSSPVCPPLRPGRFKRSDPLPCQTIPHCHPQV